MESDSDFTTSYFADLGDESALTPTLVREAALALKRNRREFLQWRSTGNMIQALAKVGENWQDPDYRFRKLIRKKGPDQTGFSAQTLDRGLSSFFDQLNRDNLEALISQEFGHQRRLDGMSTNKEERFTDRSAIATGPELLVHICAGTLPNSTLTNMVFGLLVGSAQFVKCGRGASFIPRAFAHSIYEEEPKMGACFEIAEWAGGNAQFEEPLFAEASCVTAMGSDETIRSLRDRLPLDVKFLGYGHRLSFGYVAQEMLEGFLASETVRNAALDVAAWDQRGCLSPHVFYVEKGGAIAPAVFARCLAEELEKLQKTQPRADLTPEESAVVATRRSLYELRAASDEGTRLWSSEDSTDWTVIFETDPQWQTSCANRFVYVKEVQNVEETRRHLEPIREFLSTAGIAAPDERVEELATAFARFGVTRVCPIGRMQSPPLTWRHDGQPALANLVTWTDWEQ
jgi:hypothetical protein